MRLGRRFRNEETAGAAVTTGPSTLPKSLVGLSIDSSIADGLLLAFALLAAAIGSSSSWTSLAMLTAFSAGSSLLLSSMAVADESDSDFLADNPENRLRRSVRLT